MNKYHFIGIGGVGMSALARILLEKKVEVTGSDISKSATVDELQAKGALVAIGQSAANVPQGSTIIYSSDIKKDNPEYRQAEIGGHKLLHRSELLRDLAKGYKTLAVAGTHGKTTTTSLLFSVLLGAGLDPAFAVGGTVPGLANGKNGDGEYFVLEADESDGTFINYNPFAAIVTNIEPEHMVHYKTEERLLEAFGNFIGKVESKKHFFYCLDDAGLNKLRLNEGISYGFSEKADLRIGNFRAAGWKILFDLSFEGKDYKNVEVALAGRHNALNAAAVFGLCLRLNVKESAIRQGLKNFAGVKRRLEKKGEHREVLLLDDYGHHPTEIKATLSALREAVCERRIIAVFQPHRYSRVADHLEEFAEAFDFADQVFITEIYGAREQPIPGITSEKILERLKVKSTVPAKVVSRASCVSCLKEFVRPHDVVVTFGAGDITALHQELNKEFLENPPKKYALGLVYGGKSCEHEISIRSAKYVAASLDSNLYDVKYFGITKKGNWIIGERAKEYLQTKTALECDEEAKSVLAPEIAKEIEACDVFFPVLHGPFGEDGTIQGFFEMLGKPYAGPDFRTAAITMDKVLTKKLLHAVGVPTPPYISFSFWEWRKDKVKCLSELDLMDLKYPLYVKPGRVGSSVGVSRVSEPSELVQAIEGSFRFDIYTIIEEGVVNARELEFPTIGNDRGRTHVASPGEKIAQGEFVDYQKKYSTQPVKTTIEPIFEPGICEKGQALALKAYEGLGLTGMSRVDALLDQEGNYWFFEINSIPGLTSLSLFPKIWAREGISGQALMNRLVILGLHRALDQNRHLNPL